MSDLWAIAAAGLLLATFGANEITHGGVSEGLGLGHQHMADVGGYHCAPHDHPDLGAAHVAHMHGEAANGTEAKPRSHHDHRACYDAGSGMHDRHARDGDGDHRPR